MPTIGSRRCGIRATASHCLGVAPARVAIDRAPPGPSHDGDALRGCSPSCWPYKSSQLFDCDEQGAGPALPPVSCLSSALTAATGSLAVSPTRPWRSRTVRLSIISRLVHGQCQSTREDHLVIYARKIRDGDPKPSGKFPVGRPNTFTAVVPVQWRADYFQLSAAYPAYRDPRGLPDYVPENTIRKKGQERWVMIDGCLLTQ